MYCINLHLKLLFRCRLHLLTFSVRDFFRFLLLTTANQSEYSSDGHSPLLEYTAFKVIVFLVHSTFIAKTTVMPSSQNILLTSTGSGDCCGCCCLTSWPGTENSVLLLDSYSGFVTRSYRCRKGWMMETVVYEWQTLFTMSYVSVNDIQYYKFILKTYPNWTRYTILFCLSHF